MQHNWVKFFWKFWNGTRVGSNWARLGAAAAFFLVSTHGFATVSLEPANGGSLSPRTSGGGGIFYYFVSGPGTPEVAAPAFAPFTPLDVTQTLDSDASPLMNQFEVNLSSDANFSALGTGQAVITVNAVAPNQDSTVRPAPIASVNGTRCNDTICAAYNQVPGTNAYYAAKYTPGVNRRIRIGFYPNAACSAFARVPGATALYPTGCTQSGTASTLILPEAGIPTTMQFHFNILTSANSGALTVPSSSSLDKTTSAVTFSFQVDTPAFGCPDRGTVLTSYSPGDSSISFNGDGFGISTAAGAAPSQNIFVVAKENGDPNLGIGFRSANDVASPLPLLGAWRRVDGFKNSSPGDNHVYNVSFVIADRAGVYVPAPAGCAINGVQAASIQGYLGKSNCFIATAAFKDPTAIPVRILRVFRDTVLLKNPFGKGFVRWYYSWSPEAADWLSERPQLRVVVLFALVPFELLAWVLGSPFAGALLGAALGLMVWAALARSKWMAKGAGTRKLWFGVFLLSLVASPGAFGKESYTGAEQKRLQELDEKKGILPSTGSYTEKEKEKLPSVPQESFIEKMKSQMPADGHIDSTGGGAGGTPDRESYLDREKRKLGEKPTGGAIEAVLAGKSDLHPVRRGEPHFAFGLRYGVVVNRQNSASGSAQVRDFNDVYGSTYAPDLSLFWEYQLFRNEWLGSLGVLGSSGVSIFKGKGKLGATIQKPDGSGPFPSLTETQYQLIVLPVTLGLDYRFSAFKYLRPYVMAGGNVTGVVETRNDGVQANKGYSWGYAYSLGAALLLNWIVPGDSFDLYLVHGVHQFYLTFEYSQLACVGGLVNFNASGFWGGVTFEY